MPLRRVPLPGRVVERVEEEVVLALADDGRPPPPPPALPPPAMDSAPATPAAS